ncbi:threonine--tRNA ligase [Puerhibacterium sp. TATVAM-FAB25]|uniref:threonine--tRNA ligase n=1 Tax=Puerhibacterium sp. TATVAM-FAB25 TaxID=3093699 RepID=UPI00397AE610
MSHQPAARPQSHVSLPADDHRRLGRELDLFASDPLLPAGMPILLPRGAVVRGELERYIVDAERAAGYQHVYSPPLGRRQMYEISGHWDHYADAMFPPIDDGAGQIVLRPMNCPHHIVAFRSRPRSWRQMPVRIAELGAMFRNEPSGSLSGLSRVRAMVLNDAHHFADPRSSADEVALVLSMIEDAYRVLGLSGHHYRLSLRGEGSKFLADDALWERSEAALAGALDDLGVPYDRAHGEAAFYGPKIDVQVPGRGGREESFSSVQLDFHLPSRYGLSYAGPDGPRRPVMLHRSVLSSMERCLSFLLEQHAGNLPLWLAPVQLVVMPVDPASGDQARAAAEVAQAARAAGLRVDLDDAREPLGVRVSRARRARAPYRVVVGEREAAAGHVAVNVRDGRRLDPMPAQELLVAAARLSAARSLSLWP